MRTSAGALASRRGPQKAQTLTEHVMSGPFPILRGLIAVLMLTCGVPLVSLAIFHANRDYENFVMRISFGVVLTWMFLFLPHLVLCRSCFHDRNCCLWAMVMAAFRRTPARLRTTDRCPISGFTSEAPEGRSSHAPCEGP